MRRVFGLIILILTLCVGVTNAQEDRAPTSLLQLRQPVKVSKPGFDRNADVSKKHNWGSLKKQGPRPDSIASPVEIEKDTSIKVEKGKTMIYLERSNLIRFDNEALPDVQVLEGNVLLRHEDAHLYCDSAYLNQVTNSFEAFGRVKMTQGDTLVITAKHLIYNGNTKTAYLHEKVKMKNRDVVLTTDTLTFEREKNLGYYTCGGTLKDKKNTLVSKNGYYHSDTKLAEFKYDVLAYNEDTRIESDTLTYNTSTEIAGMVGPTVIHNIDHDDPDSVETVIYSDLGWYDTANDQAELLNHSQIVHDKHNFLTGDTIFYDNDKGFGKCFHNIEMNDTSNKMMLTGHYGYYQESGEIMLVTDSARIINYQDEDTIFAHADTLYSFAVDTNKVAIAYHNARIYSKEYQAISDSVMFNTIDSVTHLMQIPILWNEEMQVTGDTIRIYPKNEDEIDRMHVKGNAMVVQKEDSIHFDQISGKDLIGYLFDNELEHVEVLGNAESIFFPTDEDQLIGLNKMQSSYMNVYFKDGEVDRIKVFPSPTAVMYPMEQVIEPMLKLANFTWQIEARPKDKDDIFTRPKRATKEEIEAQKKEIREKEKAEKRKKRMENEANSDNKKSK